MRKINKHHNSAQKSNSNNPRKPTTLQEILLDMAHGTTIHSNTMNLPNAEKTNNKKNAHTHTTHTNKQKQNQQMVGIQS